MKTSQRRSRLALELRDAIRGGAYERPLINVRDRVGVAVSGGADSVALLRLLLELREDLGIAVCVVHLNHQLRGRAADRDEKFVAKLARDYRLEFFVDRVDVGARAKRNKLNLEDAARRTRYEFFSSLVKQGKVDRIATAHTADDQAETVLAHILRGSGLAGIAGIHAVSGDVVRPLLGTRREDLRAYLKQQKQTWREDATNRDTTHLRARIRKKLIPLLEKQFQPATVQHLATLAEFAREDSEFIETAVEREHSAATKKTIDGVSIPVTRLHVVPSIRRRIVRRIVKEVKPQEGEIGSKHVEAVLRLTESGENGKSLQLPGGLEVRRDRDQLVFRAVHSKGSELGRKQSANRRADSNAKEFEHPVEMRTKETTVDVPCLARSFRFSKIDWSEESEETSSNGSVLDHDALRKPIVLRNWRPGDTFQPSGHRKPHKLKRLLNEKRISRWERDGWPVLTSAGVIAWVRGFAVGAAFAVTAKTKAAVLIEEYATSSH